MIPDLLVILAAIAIMACGLALTCLYWRWRIGRARQTLLDWIEANGWELVEMHYCYLKGPFPVRSKEGTEVFRFAIRDAAGQTRWGYARCGGWIVGVLENTVETQWDDEPPRPMSWVEKFLGGSSWASSPRNRWRRHWKWLVATVILMSILMPAVALNLFQCTDVYAEAMARAEANPQVRAALGAPIHAGFFVTGRISGGRFGHARLSIPVSGPNGSGTITAVADKVNGQWRFSTLRIDADANGVDCRMDLLARP
jgi:hypothetical protein